MIFEVAPLQLLAQLAQRQIEVKAGFFWWFFLAELRQHFIDFGRVDVVAVGGERQAFDDAAQLLQIARPVVLAQGIQRGSGQPVRRHLFIVDQLGQKLLGQLDDVVSVLAQAGDGHNHAGQRGQQAIVAGGIDQQLLQRPAARTHQAHVVALQLGQQEQQALLGAARLAADVGQIQHAVIGLLQQFQRRVGQLLRLVRRHPWGVGLMKKAGNQLKPHAWLASEQNRRLDRHHALQRALELVHHRAFAQAIQIQRLIALHIGVFHRPLHRGEQFLQGDGFFQEIKRADAGGFDGGVDAGVARHHHHRHVQLPGLGPFLEQGHPIAIGHPDVQQYQRRAGLVAQLARHFGVFRQRHGVAFVLKDFRQQLANADFIIDDQNIATSHHASGQGSVTQMRAPCGVTLPTVMLPWCSSMIFFTTARPRPVPLALLVT